MKPKILMILTSHRLDCFKLTMDALIHSKSLDKFDHVVLLLNGVVGRHLKYVHRLICSHPQIHWDTIAGPRGKKEKVANLQNECVRRYPDSIYFKIDEDLIVSEGWVEKLTDAYEAHKHDDNLALITPVIPNNGAGFNWLLTAFPELTAEYHSFFNFPITPVCNGAIWDQPSLAKWIIRKFIDLDAANKLLENHACLTELPPYQKFAYRFSINCLVYDYRHWQQMGGIPNDEEPAWGQWVPDHGKFNVLVTNTLVQHYSFFVQQDWLDRSSVLEDLRRINLPDTLPSRISPRYFMPRLIRIAIQLPRVVPRKIRSLMATGRRKAESGKL